ncbi:tumor protein D52 isoform X2 [Brachionichthys hirsutus]|uniref:tumor protein D52 isoform X2 n=1 Tax=Brachionichthys hirsutus TaxID=412623 RepID=UPI003604F7D6
MEDTGKDSQQHLDWATEVDEDEPRPAAPYSSPPPAMTEEERQELQEELAKVEDEIQTLTQVLSAKEKQVADIKKKLGVTPLNELKQNITKTWQEVTTSMAYRRTSETLSNASLKATTAITNVSQAISKKLGDVRNASSFKSFEEQVENLKTKMSVPAAAASPSSGDQDGTPPTESLLTEPEGSPTQERPNN